MIKHYILLSLWLDILTTVHVCPQSILLVNYVVKIVYSVLIKCGDVCLQLISVLPMCHSIEVDILVTSLLSQLQCGIYHSASSMITALADCLKCLAKDPLQFMDSNDYGDADKDTLSLCCTVSLESILG